MASRATRMRTRAATAALRLCAFLLALLAPSRALAARAALKAAPGTRASNPALAWNAAALDAIRADKVPPPKAARLLAILHIAIRDAVDACAPTNGSAYAAAATAGHTVLAALAPAQAGAAAAVRGALLAAEPPGAAREAGAACGAAAAAAALAARADDGAGAAAGGAPLYGEDAPGLWRAPRLPSGERAPALLPDWGAVRPFSLTPAEAAALVAAVPPPPPLGSGEWRAALDEVRGLGSRDGGARSADETELALFWADGAGTATPPGHWNAIAAGALATRGAGLAEAARALALLNVALADAGILAWAVKFKHNFWRPVDALEAEGAPGAAAASGGNGAWAPLLATPPFPEHVSGHSTFSAAAAAVLAGALGDGAFECGSDGMAGILRSFPSFEAAAAESGFSRICGGIHFASGNAAGLALGRAVGKHVLHQ
jgi:hypothetical protein